MCIKCRAVLLCLFACCSWASDLIGIDSLFKQQTGLRSITSLSLVSSGNANAYSTYPNLSVASQVNDATDNKQIALQQTLLYRVVDSLDLMLVGLGSYLYSETNLNNNFSHSHSTKFDALWLGGSYTAPTFYNFSPQITLQMAVLQREALLKELKTFYASSYSAQFMLRSYSDPVVYSLYVGTTQNLKRHFKQAKLHYGSEYNFGIDLSIILSPKVSLDMGLEQNFQTAIKVNNRQTTTFQSLPSLSMGVTYSINDNTAFAISGNMSGSSSAPDSIFGIVLWKKF